MKLSIIVPFYNEEKTLAIVLQKLKKLRLKNWQKEIIAVDDGSGDNSLSLTKKFDIKVLRHRNNLGKGAAVRNGLKIATGDYVLIQDSDLEYNPEDIPKILEKLRGKTKVIYGSRNLKPKNRGYFLYVWGDGLLTSLVNLLFGSDLTDLYTGYKLIKTDLIKSLDLKSDGFDFEAEVTTKILKKGIRIVEVPISYSPRTFSEGKKIKFLDAVKGFWSIISAWLN